ncbi:MAG: hypothetical protein BWY82_02873 [Verrucomicrobia bacterium ADurb.Bin474]|nr:MAG: hypothetical protein BWY82_02873 [Verrucomicrobia bacterium ADurb.Bin474]
MLQDQADHVLCHDLGSDFEFNNGTSADPADGRMVLLHSGATGTTRSLEKSAHCDRTLSHRVGHIIRTHQRSLEEHATVDRLGIPDR